LNQELVGMAKNQDGGQKSRNFDMGIINLEQFCDETKPGEAALAHLKETKSRKKENLEAW